MIQYLHLTGGLFVISYVFYLLIIIIFILNVVSIFINKKNAFAFLLLLGVCWLLSWSTNGGPDYFAYFSHYSNIQISSLASQFEIGYNLVVFIFSKLLKLTFDNFRAVYYGLGYILIGNTIWRLAKQPNFILLLYSLILMPVDVIQIRNFLAMAILVHSFFFLLQNKYFKSCLFIFIASLIHSTFIIYLPVVLILALMNGNFRLRQVELLLIILIYALILQLFQPKLVKLIYQVAVQYISIDKMVYFETETRYGHWLFWGYQIFLIFCYYLLPPKISSENEDMALLYNNYKLILNLNYILVLTFPVFLFNANFQRLFRNILIINFIQIINNGLFVKRSDVISIILILLYIFISWYLFSDSIHVVSSLFKYSKIL